MFPEALKHFKLAHDINLGRKMSYNSTPRISLFVMGDPVHIGAGTKRLLGKQPSHQNSASLFLAFVAETSQEKILILGH
jgi:hypothetical protein